MKSRSSSSPKSKKMNLTEFKKQKKALEGQIATHGKAALADAFKTFFQANPSVDAVRWTQYTPHFNDGDVCEFGRNGFLVSGTFDVEDAPEEEDDEGNFYDVYSLDKLPVGKALKELEKTFSGADELFEASFGDG